MAWDTPRTWTATELVTAAMMNQNVRDNVAYLKGQAGAVTIEDDVTVEGAMEAVSMQYDGGFANPKNLREMVIDWHDEHTQDNIDTEMNVDENCSGSGHEDSDGTGQIVLYVNGDTVGRARVENLTSSNGLDNSWDASKYCYMRAEFALDEDTTVYENFAYIFIGLRQTLQDDPPASASENYAGIWYEKTSGGFYARTGDGSGNDNSSSVIDWTADQRYIVEIKFWASSVEIWVNGTRQLNATSNLPTGMLDWQLQFCSDGTGADTDYYMTLGRVILQENLS